MRRSWGTVATCMRMSGARMLPAASPIAAGLPSHISLNAVGGYQIPRIYPKPQVRSASHETIVAQQSSSSEIKTPRPLDACRLGSAGVAKTTCRSLGVRSVMTVSFGESALKKSALFSKCRVPRGCHGLAKDAVRLIGDTLPWVAITSAFRRAMTVNTTTSIAKARLIASGLPALNSCIVPPKLEACRRC